MQATLLFWSDLHSRADMPRLMCRTLAVTTCNAGLQHLNATKFAGPYFPFCALSMSSGEKEKKRKVYTVRRHDGSLCMQKQAKTMGRHIMDCSTEGRQELAWVYWASYKYTDRSEAATVANKLSLVGCHLALSSLRPDSTSTTGSSPRYCVSSSNLQVIM